MGFIHIVVLPALQCATQIMPLVQTLFIVVGVEIRIEEIPLFSVSWAITFKRSKHVKQEDVLVLADVG